MSLDDQNRLRCITQTQKISKNQSSYLTLLDGISPQWSADTIFWDYFKGGTNNLEIQRDPWYVISGAISTSRQYFKWLWKLEMDSHEMKIAISILLFWSNEHPIQQGDGEPIDFLQFLRWH